MISGAAEVSHSVLWDNVVIAPGAQIKHAVIGDDVRIPEGEVIEHAAVVRASLVTGKPPPPKALKGDIRGHNFVVSLTQ